MPRELIHVTRSASRLTDTTTIEPGYPKPYSAEEMRTWADDLDRLHKTSAADLERWQSMPAEQLAAEQRRTLAVRDNLMTDHERGICGSLGPDGRIELDKGRHRAGYMIERGVDPIPVWVSAPDQRQLDALRAQCERERPPLRTEQAARAEPPPRVAAADERRERDPGRTNDRDSGGDRSRA